MLVGFNNISSINAVNPIKVKNIGFRGVTQPNDSFQSTMTPETITRKKFDALFPNGEINKVYAKINKDFEIDNPAKLKFVYDETSQLGGGYTFHTNEIEMNLYDLMSSNKKIVGVKNGVKIPLVSPKDKLPLFIGKELAVQFVDTHNKKGSFGFDRLIVEDVTPKELKKLIIQKIAHECVHAKQHQILRETEGIGDKEIIKAWTHYKPKNAAEQESLNRYAEQTYQTTPWAKMGAPVVKYKIGSQVYQKAIVLLNAILNYPPVNSPLYTSNPLEQEAFDIAARYVKFIPV